MYEIYSCSHSLTRLQEELQRVGICGDASASCVVSHQRDEIPLRELVQITAAGVGLVDDIPAAAPATHLQVHATWLSPGLISMYVLKFVCMYV
jgi:hypothetical protein